MVEEGAPAVKGTTPQGQTTPRATPQKQRQVAGLNVITYELYRCEKYQAILMALKKINGSILEMNQCSLPLLIENPDSIGFKNQTTSNTLKNLSNI